jgi:uncharacterized protein YecE (DUF72 family)
MEFGKIEDITGIDWSLPVEDPSNFTKPDSSAHPKNFFGAPAWGSKHWVGKIYPKESRPDQFLHHYAKNFNCIELNTTHYRIPNPETAAEWCSQVPQGFRFCPKVHKDISHSKLGLQDKSLLEAWLRFLEKMQGFLGPCFIQFHETFSYADKVHLFKFLERWPKDFRLTIELRHPSWFKDHTILPGLRDYLQTKGMGLVITDVAGRRDVLHSSISSDWTMVRLIGNDLADSDEERLKAWAQRLKSWQQKSVNEIYLFLHQPDDVWTIEFAQLAQRIFTESGFSPLPQIEMIKPLDLFHQDWNQP